MTILIISIVAAWIIFSALLVTIICMNSSRLSRMDDERWTQEEIDAAIIGAKEMRERFGWEDK